MIAKMFEEEVKNMLKEPYERQHAKKREGFAFGAVQCFVTHRRHLFLFCFVLSVCVPDSIPSGDSTWTRTG